MKWTRYDAIQINNSILVQLRVFSVGLGYVRQWFEIGGFLRFEVRFGCFVHCWFVIAKLQRHTRLCRIQACHQVFAVLSASLLHVLVPRRCCTRKSAIVHHARHIHRLLQYSSECRHLLIFTVIFNSFYWFSFRRIGTFCCAFKIWVQYCHSQRATKVIWRVAKSSANSTVILV